jgi:hypothetical protein
LFMQCFMGSLLILGSLLICESPRQVSLFVLFVTDTNNLLKMAA